MVVDDDNLVDLAAPLFGKHANCGRAAADAHSLFGHAIYDWRPAGLHHNGRAAVDLEFHRLAIGEVHQRIAGDAPLFLRTTGQMMDAAERQHLRTVFARGNVSDGFALRAHGRRLRAEVTVRVDLHLDAAIAKDAL